MHDNHSQRRLRIALVTALDVFDRRSWSGTFYYMTRALQKHCGDVMFIGPMDASREMLPAFLMHKSANFLLKRNYAYRHTLAVSKRYAQIAGQRLANQKFDIVVALSGATELAFLQTTAPKILIEDANFALLQNYHAQFSSLLKSSVRQLNMIQTKGIAQADLVLYSTEWAAQSAVSYYAADNRKIRVIPFGANIEHIPPKEHILERKKHTDICRLLFVGVNWQRKGGDIAYETLLSLERQGIAAELTVCGSVPPKHIQHPRMKVIPFLDKNDEGQRRQLEMLYMQSDFFILPTRNECFGIVFCEASAFGLPSITTHTGGVPEVVKDGVNGYTLPYSARGDAYADVIARLYQDDATYHRLVRTCRERFDALLNWDAWGEATNHAITELLRNQKQPLACS